MTSSFVAFADGRGSVRLYGAGRNCLFGKGNQRVALDETDWSGLMLAVRGVGPRAPATKRGRSGVLKRSQAWRARRAAATQPADPPPTTIKSYCFFIKFTDRHCTGSGIYTWEDIQYDTVLVQIVPEALTQQQMLEAGDVDLVTRIPNENYSTFKDNSDYTIQQLKTKNYDSENTHNNT